MLIDSIATGGAQRQFCLLANGLHDAGFSVSVYFYHGDKSDLNTFRDGITLEVGSTQRSFSPKLGALQFMRCRRTETFISFLSTPNLINAVAGLSGAGGRRIVSERSLDVGPQRFRARLVRGLYRGADKVVCNSLSQARVMVDRYGLGGKVEFIPNCVDSARFTPQVKSQSYSPAVRRGIVIANIKVAKNYPFLIKAMSNTDGERVAIDWFGDIVDENEFQRGQEIQSNLDHNGGADSVTFRGPVANPEVILNNYDFLCLPSLYEGMPNVVCEAMAAGLPILCSDVSDNRFIVEDGVNGFLFDPKKECSFKDALHRLCSLSQGEIREMGMRNRERAESEYGVEKYVQSWISIIKT